MEKMDVKAKGQTEEGLCALALSEDPLGIRAVLVSDEAQRQVRCNSIFTQHTFVVLLQYCGS